MVVFQNEGLIDVRTINTFGVCVKEEGSSPIGYFGTGLKYALAVLLREGLSVVMYHGLNKFVFSVGQRAIRDKDFGLVKINDTELPFTTELGKNWQLWHAYRELASNTLDEGGTITQEGDPKEGYTTFIVEGAAFEAIHCGAYGTEVFLSSKPLHVFKEIEFHEVPTGGAYWVYYRGIRVYKLGRPAQFTYNLLRECALTEDRTLADSWRIDQCVADALSTCKSPSLIRQLLEAHQQYYESTIDYTWSSKSPGGTFNDVVSHYGYTGVSFNSSAKAFSGVTKTTAPRTVIKETLTIETRKKLWAACRFWGKLGYEIDHKEVLIAHTLDDAGATYGGTIYLAEKTLAEDVRTIAGVIFRHHIGIKHEAKKMLEGELLVDTIVVMGERILGLTPRA